MAVKLLSQITLLGLALSAPLAGAQDFRMETDVFGEGQKTPVAQYLTLFQGNTIYDFVLAEPQQVTIFDTTRRRLILLDSARQVKVELTTGEIETFHQRLREQVSNRQSALFETDLAYTYDEPQRWHVLTGEAVEYRARGAKPKFPEAAVRYRVFADWYAQLNAMRPGNPPPYARMQLNKVLAEQHLLPEEIQRTLTVGKLPPRRSQASSQHHVNWLLSEPDHKRIKKAGDWLTEFRSVALQEFFQINQVAQSSK